MLIKAAGEEIFRAHKKGATEENRAAAHYDEFSRAIDEYRTNRSILLWGLEQYLQFKHSGDFGAYNKLSWPHLRAFANKLYPGDVVITFSYDSTLERVLLQQDKWSPRNGYGFEIIFQRSATDTTSVEFENSPAVTLHLHGGCGWYKRPLVKNTFIPSSPADRSQTKPPLQLLLTRRSHSTPRFSKDLGLLLWILLTYITAS